MGFMVPVAQYFTEAELYEHNGSIGGFAPDDCYECGEPTEWASNMHSEQTLCKECAANEPGWYARLSAPGYMDCTDWLGPYDTEKEALQGIMDEHEVDEEGNDIEA